MNEETMTNFLKDRDGNPIICANCGAMIPESDSYKYNSRSEAYLCEDCCDDGYTFCEDCRCVIDEDDAVTVNNGYRTSFLVCRDCADNYVECDCCGEVFTTSHIWASDNYTDICDNCCDEYYVCADCECIVANDDACFIDDIAYCERCAENHHRRMHNYGYKPLPKFGTKKEKCAPVVTDSYTDSDLTIGVELEIDHGDDVEECCDALNGITSMLYLKHDGSLDEGIEIVSHPCTLSYHMDVFPWKEVCENATSFGFLSHDAGTCGLHFHVGRDQLGGSQQDQVITIGKIIALTDRLWGDGLYKFSRRRGERWCARNNSPVNEGLLSESIYSAMLNVYNDSHRKGRYLAVNVMNTSTVEFRFCRGTLNVETFYASMQLIHNLVEFAMTTPITDILSAKFDDVVHYREYPELNAYMLRRFGATGNTEENIEEPNRIPSVGDVVELLCGVGCSNRTGLFGLVLAQTGNNCAVRVLSLTDGHDCGGLILFHRHSGWNVNMNQVRIVDDAAKKEAVLAGIREEDEAFEAANADNILRIGDRVRCREDANGHDRGRVLGKTGTVVAFLYSDRTGALLDTDTDLLTAVRWDDLHSGHDCRGRCEDGHGWNVAVRYLERV